MSCLCDPRDCAPEPQPKPRVRVRAGGGPPLADLVAEFLHRAHVHTNALDAANASFTVRKALKALQNHHEVRAAEERRKKKFFSFLERCAKEVSSWPAWKRGEASNRRQPAPTGGLANTTEDSR